MMHVLVIEPDRIQAATYSAALERLGNTVTQAVSAQGAIQAADEHTPDVVVLELQLSSHNGVEFLYEFRSYPEWWRIPIVLHTFISPSQLTYANMLEEQLGVSRILYKPETTLADLCRAVGSVSPLEL